jgi:hypothetical protein
MLLDKRAFEKQEPAGLAKRRVSTTFVSKTAGGSYRSGVRSRFNRRTLR